jgi:hypothetical protein
MNGLYRIVVFAGLMGGAVFPAFAAPAPAECSAGAHLGQSNDPAPAASAQDRVEEYLEFHALATEANGPAPLFARPALPPRVN